MARNWDEPFALRGLLAARMDIADDRSAVTFTLHPRAAFADGSPVTPEDVIFSMETLRDRGRPNFRSYYGKVGSVAATGPRAVTFTFAQPERELPLLLGLMPILSRADWQDRDFAETTLRPPLGSGPYRVSGVEVGDSITLERRDDYWGHDLPVNRGLHNLDTITLLHFRNDNALWEAFKAGIVHVRQEDDPDRWRDGYDFPAARDGRIARKEIAHGRPTGMEGLVFNTRRPPFDDIRVRDALIHAFDFEWLNATLNDGAFERIRSYYANSALAHRGAATGAERALLLPFADTLPPGTMKSAYAPPQTDGSGRDRANLREAARLLREAGWRVEDGTLRDADGAPFAFEILLSGPADEKVAAPFARALNRLGIAATLRVVDGAQYQARLTEYDYDMVLRRWWLSLSPGGEQDFYFGSGGVARSGTRNYMGADHPAIDAAIGALIAAEDAEAHAAATRALDRVLTHGRYVIPVWHDPVKRIAWWKPLARPAREPLYGYRPETWWSGDE